MGVSLTAGERDRRDAEFAGVFDHHNDFDGVRCRKRRPRGGGVWGQCTGHIGTHGRCMECDHPAPKPPVRYEDDSWGDQEDDR